MPFDRRELCESLERKGFVKSENSNHTTLSYEPSGIQTAIATSVSRGSKSSEIDESIAYDYMKTQIKLDTNNEFDRLVECPMGAEEYYDKLVQKGAVDPTLIAKSKPKSVVFEDSEVESIKKELERRMKEEFHHSQSTMHGKIDNGKLKMEDVKELKSMGILDDAGIEIDV